MLALWREWGLEAILRKAYQAGVVLAGISAGANCWFEQFSTDSLPGDLTVMAGLGLLNGSFTPHYDGEAERRPALHRMLQHAAIVPGLAADNSAGVHFVDGQLVQAICSRETAQVYHVHLTENQVIEEPLAMMKL
jgi:peptidase E